MKRLARWLRLVVTCLAFVSTAAPAVAAEAFDRIVLVADEEAREESRTEIASAERPARVIAEPVASTFEPPRLVSRRWLTNCAFLL